MQKDFLLNTVKNNILRISAFGIENIENSPCLIFVHGFKGFKDWGFFPFSAKYFSDRGFFVLTFNFSHNGVGDSLTEFDEPDKFAKNTFSLELSELNELIDAYFNGFFGSGSGKGIGLIGHSRGGAIVLLNAAERNDVKAAAVWSSVCKLDRYTERQKKEWREKGVVEILNSRTKQVMSLNVSLLEDIEKNKNGKLNLEKAVKNINKPLLIVHGEQDLTVKIDEAEQIYNWANPDLTEIYRVPAAGHTFNIVHPFNGSNDKFDSVLEVTYNFFRNKLN